MGSETPTSQARGLEQGNKQVQNLGQELKNRINEASTQRGPGRRIKVKLEVPELDIRTRKINREKGAKE